MCLTNHSLFLIVSFVRCTRLICVQGVVHKTHAEQKIGFKGSQWVLHNATVVVVYGHKGPPCA